MAVRASTLLAVGAAFAVGVAATVGFDALRSDNPPVTQRTSQAEPHPPGAGQERPRIPPGGANAPGERAGSADQAWSDPVKRPAPPASSAGASRPPLTFRSEEAEGAGPPVPPKMAGEERPRVVRAEAENGGVRADAEKAQAQRPRAQQARAEPRAEPDETAGPRARPGRTRIAPADPGLAAERALPRRPAPATLAARPGGLGEDGQPSLAADKTVRRVVTRPGGARNDEARRPDERPQPVVAARGGGPEVGAQDARKRLSVAESGGVMQWLMEPGGRF